MLLYCLMQNKVPTEVKLTERLYLHTVLQEKYSCYVAVGRNSPCSLFYLQCNGVEMTIMEEQNIEFKRRNVNCNQPVWD